MGGHKHCIWHCHEHCIMGRSQTYFALWAAGHEYCHCHKRILYYGPVINVCQNVLISRLVISSDILEATQEHQDLRVELNEVTIVTTVTIIVTNNNIVTPFNPPHDRGKAELDGKLVLNH